MRTPWESFIDSIELALNIREQGWTVVGLNHPDEMDVAFLSPAGAEVVVTAQELSSATSPVDFVMGLAHSPGCA